MRLDLSLVQSVWREAAEEWLKMADLGGEIIERVIPGVELHGDSILRFENQGPGEWLTKAGNPAKIARRRYLLNGQELDSVSSIVGVLSKDGLYSWYEDHGARGAVEAMEVGELDGVPVEEVIKRVRFLGLGARAARDEGADRGQAIHKAFQALASTGEAPKFSDYPSAWRPWVQGCAKAWLMLDPEPIETEFIVCHPELGYAGRADLLCRSKGQRVLLDYKTGRGRIYEQAHYQTRGYAEACVPSGIDAPDRIMIVGVADDSSVLLEDCAATPEDWSALVLTYRSRKRVNTAMAAARVAADRREIRQ